MQLSGASSNTDEKQNATKKANETASLMQLEKVSSSSLMKLEKTVEEVNTEEREDLPQLPVCLPEKGVEDCIMQLLWFANQANPNSKNIKLQIETQRRLTFEEHKNSGLA